MISRKFIDMSTVTRLRTFAACAAGLAGLTSLPAAQAQSQTGGEYPSVAVRTGHSRGQGFAIKNPSGQPACLVVTAAHVVKLGDDVVIAGLDRTQATPRQFTVMATVYEIIGDAGLAVLRPKSDLPTCSPLRPGNVQAALSRDATGRAPFFNEVTGEMVFSRLVLEGSTVSSLNASSVGSRRISPGFSGGLLTLDGEPLAVIQEVDAEGVVKASRLDYSKTFTTRYASIPVDAAAAPTRKPWDVSFLPADYQKVMAAAITVRKEAETAQRVAKQNAADAADAELRARAGSQGHAEVSDDTGTYRGQIDSRGFVSGAGIRTISATENLGNTLSGRWRTTDEKKGESKIFGPGVHKLESNSGNVNGLDRFEGILKAASYDGPGVLTMKDGAVWFGTWKDDNLNSIVQLVRSDGYIFTGTAANGNLNGPCILWTGQGQIFAVGIWKDGKLVDDKTAALTRQ